MRTVAIPSTVYTTTAMEKVIQMYLRNEYETIAEYNAQAGSIAEKYHFLVIASFPVNFSDTAAQRLRNIAASGARCGVYTLVHWDLCRNPVDLEQREGRIQRFGGLAIRRAERKYGVRFDARRVVVIGDTPHDIKGAHDNGAVAVGVATGGSSAEELTAAGADVVLADLTKVDALRHAVTDPTQAEG